MRGTLADSPRDRQGLTTATRSGPMPPGTGLNPSLRIQEVVMRPTLARPAQGGRVPGTISTACSAERLRVCGLRSTPVGRRGCKPSWQNHHGLPLWAVRAGRRPTGIDMPRRRRALPASHREDDLSVSTPIAWRIGIRGRRSGSRARRSVCDDSTVEDASGSDGEEQFTGSILVALRPLHRWRRPSRPAQGELRCRQTGVRMTAGAERSTVDIHSLVHRSYSHSYPQPLSRGSQDP
jgi:hypothetical protein